MREPRLSVALFLFALSLGACKPRVDDSDVKHTFGETRKDLAQPQKPCDQANYASTHPVADSYIRKLAGHLADANPKTLSGAYSLEHFCFAMNESDEFNAMAMAQFMLVMLNRPILRYAMSDAEVASVLAHELAHVVMRHDQALHPAVATLPEVVQLSREAQDFEAKALAARTAQDALAAEQRAHYKAVGERLTKNFPAFGAAVRRMEELNSEALRLLKKPPFFPGTPTDPLPQSQMSSFDGEGLDAEGKKHYQNLRDEYAKQSEIARAIDGKARTKAESNAGWAFFDRSMKLSMEAGDALGAAGDRRAKIADRTVALLGKDVAANWKEAEADEVGYELYLRAGFIGEGFTWINRIIAQVEIGKADEGLLSRSTDEVLDACLKARNDLKEGLLRGAEDHPTSCWRLADIRMKEDKDHEAEYASLKAAAKTMNLSGSPTLAEAQAEIAATSAKK